MMKVPFLDLDAQYQSIKEEVRLAIDEVLESKKFIQGEFCQEFSKKFLDIHGGEFGVGCSNGTSAITLALKALGIGPGDEVITVANTFFATIEAIAEVGAKIVLVDCDPKSYLINHEQVEDSLTARTKAIIPVHLYGNPVNMVELQKIASENNLFIIEDCAQAHLAQLDGQAVGTFGDAGTFSFYPGKNLGAYGDAGFVLSSNKELNDKVSMYLNHGRIEKYQHNFLAGNDRMDAIQAAILTIKCKYIDNWTQKRIEAAFYYDKKLTEAGFKIIEKNEKAKAVYHLYVVEVQNRSETISNLQKKGVSTGIHYPIPMHLQPACRELNYKKGSYPVSEKVSERIISLPIYPEISKDQQDYVVNNFLKIARP